MTNEGVAEVNLPPVAGWVDSAIIIRQAGANTKGIHRSSSGGCKKNIRDGVLYVSGDVSREGRCPPAEPNPT